MAIRAPKPIREEEWVSRSVELPPEHKAWYNLKVPTSEALKAFASKNELLESEGVERALHPDGHAFREKFAGQTLGAAVKELADRAREFQKKGGSKEKREKLLSLISGLSKHTYLYDELPNYRSNPRQAYVISHAIAAIADSKEMGRVTGLPRETILYNLNRIFIPHDLADMIMVNPLPKEFSDILEEGIRRLKK